MNSLIMNTQLEITFNNEELKTLDKKTKKAIRNIWEDFVAEKDKIIEDINTNYLPKDDFIKIELKHKMEG